MTSHWVMIVLLMLGVNVTRSPAGAVGPMIVSAAGNSSVPLMKHAGYSHASPGTPSFGKGGTRTSAARLMTMTPPISRNQRDERPPRPLLGCGTGASATSGVSTCSLDTLAPHTGARLGAALASSPTGRGWTG